MSENIYIDPSLADNLQVVKIDGICYEKKGPVGIAPDAVSNIDEYFANCDECLQGDIICSSGDKKEFKIVAFDGDVDDQFGRQARISGNFLAVSSWRDDDNGAESGSVYVYERTSGNTWTNETKIIASDGVAGDEFGVDVSINGDYLAVGAWQGDSAITDAGAVYVYERISGNTWGNEFKITASDSAVGSNFGVSLCICGDYLVVSDPVGSNSNGSNAGAIYVYEKTGPGNIWGNEFKIIASDGDASDNFGRGVSISGDYIIVSARFDDDNGLNSGSVYVYERTGPGNTWGNEFKITASDGNANDRFGFLVSMDGNYLTVAARFDDDNGAESGSIYVYERTGPGNTWGNEFKITASDGAAGDNFGLDAKINGDYLAVGARLDDDNGLNSGSVYVYERTSGNTWINETKITASDAASGDEFGIAVSIDGDYLAVGAHFDDDNGTDSGSVYVYQCFAH